MISQSSQRAALVLLNQKYDFRTRLHDTPITPAKIKECLSLYKILIDPVLRLFVMCCKISQMVSLSFILLQFDWLL